MPVVDSDDGGYHSAGDESFASACELEQDSGSGLGPGLKDVRTEGGVSTTTAAHTAVKDWDKVAEAADPDGPRPPPPPLPAGPQPQPPEGSEKSLERVVHEKLAETKDLLTDLRGNLPTMIQRLDMAESMKADGNSQFAEKQIETALRLYISALWLLKPRDPPLPRALGKGGVLTGASLLEALECCLHRGVDLPGTPIDDLPPEEGDQEPVTQEVAEAAGHALRLGLYRNVTRAAIEVSEWNTAQRACEFLLEGEPNDVKALFLLARAHESEGEVGQALTVLSRLLKVDPQNRAARQLTLDLRERKKRELSMFGGMFERAQKDKGLYNQAQMVKEANQRRDAEGKLRLEDIAKLEPTKWAEQIQRLNISGQDQAKHHGTDMAKSMPETAWMKHVLPNIDEAKRNAEVVRAMMDARDKPVVDDDDDD